MLSRVPQQDAPVPEIIETCFFMETEHFLIDFAIIAQAQADNKNSKKRSINSQWNTNNAFTMSNSSFISRTRLCSQSNFSKIDSMVS
jgi:hypothetical protein